MGLSKSRAWNKLIDLKISVNRLGVFWTISGDLPQIFSFISCWLSFCRDLCVCTWSLVTVETGDLISRSCQHYKHKCFCTIILCLASRGTPYDNQPLALQDQVPKGQPFRAESLIQLCPRGAGYTLDAYISVLGQQYTRAKYAANSSLRELTIWEIFINFSLYLPISPSSQSLPQLCRTGHHFAIQIHSTINYCMLLIVHNWLNCTSCFPCSSTRCLSKQYNVALNYMHNWINSSQSHTFSCCSPPPPAFFQWIWYVTWCLFGTFICKKSWIDSICSGSRNSQMLWPYVSYFHSSLTLPSPYTTPIFVSPLPFYCNSHEPCKNEERWFL